MGTGNFKSSVLKGRNRFQQLFAAGRRCHGDGISLIYIAVEKSEKSSIAICASRRIGNSVFRNRMRRLIRESVDPLIPYLQPGYQIAFLPRREFINTPVPQRIQILLKLLIRAQILTSDPLHPEQRQLPYRMER